MKKTILWLCAAPFLLYAFACAMLFATQRNLMYHPVPRMTTDVPTRPLHVGADTVLVSVHEQPGAQALVYFGGNGEDVSSTVPGLVATLPGTAIYALHYPGYGGSPGKPTEAGNVAAAFALFDLAHAAHPDVLVVGRSLGSGMAAQVAAARPAARVVLVTPYDSMATIAANRYPLFPVRWLVLDRYDSAAVAPRITAPTLLVMAERDQVIPADSTRRLLAAFKPGVARMVVLRGVGHNFPVTPEYIAAMREAVR